MARGAKLTDGRSLELASIEIRLAEAHDASSIYALMCEVFAHSFLPFSIYQSPKSISYLVSLIAEAHAQSQNALYVLKQNGGLVGYYHALRQGDVFFLNYVAIATAKQGHGLGDLLLRHFEATGEGLGCTQLALDVFERNEVARAWYARHNYGLLSTIFCIRLSLSGWSVADALPIHCATDEWSRALLTEEQQGFSKVTCACGVGTITLGLINRNVAKILDYSGIALEQVIVALGTWLNRQRQFLLLSSVAPLPSTWPVVATDAVLRMAKPFPLTATER
jgi:ribosomal protein S18 acetylase RimI-like enzyme